MLSFVLFLAALVCFLIAAFAPSSTLQGRVGFGWLGAALITVTLLIGAYPG
jgi:hypothetical protein